MGEQEIQEYLHQHYAKQYVECKSCGEKIARWVDKYTASKNPIIYKHNSVIHCSQCDYPTGYNPRAGVSLIKRPVNNYWVDNENDNLTKIYENK